MKYLSVVLFFLGTLAATAAAELLGGDDALALEKRAIIVGKAFDSADADTIIEMTHPSLFKLMGGKEKAADVTRKVFAQMRSMEMEVLESKLGPAGEVYLAADEMVCFRPRTTVMRVGDKKAKSTGFLICIRKTVEGEWLFLDGSGLRRNPGLLKVLLPALTDEVKLPENKVELIQ